MDIKVTANAALVEVVKLIFVCMTACFSSDSVFMNHGDCITKITAGSYHGHTLNH